MAAVPDHQHRGAHERRARHLQQETRKFVFKPYTRPQDTGVTGVTGVTGRPGTQESYREKTRWLDTGTEPDVPVYDTRCGRKGKACIITVHTFLQSSNFCPLEGYKVDELKLSETLTQLGFDVIIPKPLNRDDENNFTAEEIQHIVSAFAEEELHEEDRCAVLCILTHGRADVLYGSDAKEINVTKLLRKLDNTGCPQMAGKAKWVILQACQGETSDKGEVIRAASMPERPSEPVGVPQTDAASLHLPSISDMIVLYPAMTGFVSFVGSSSGSFMIRHLADVLAQYAHQHDLQTLLTLVNQRVANENIIYEGVNHKQMSHFDSCLRKLLYFLPGYDDTSRPQQETASAAHFSQPTIKAAAVPYTSDPASSHKDQGSYLPHTIKKTLEEQKSTLCEYVEEANMTVLLTELRARDALTSLQMKQASGKPIAYEKMGSVVDSLIIGGVGQYKHFRRALQLSSVGLQGLARLLPEVM